MSRKFRTEAPAMSGRHAGHAPLRGHAPAAPDAVQVPIRADEDGHDHHTHDGAASELRPHAEEALISARGLAFHRNGRDIIKRIDIDIGAEEIVTLIGPNGAGKTSLVRILLGLETPDAGIIKRRPGLVVGYVPQRFDLERAVPLTVTRFLDLGGRAGAREAEVVLAEVGAAALGERQLTQLSGGELQRVLFARALIREPGLLVLDEPVRGVDFAGEAELYDLIGRLRTSRGFGVLLVSHDLHVVMAQSDRVVCINRHVCCSGRPQSVARHPEYARLFGPQAARAFGVYEHSHDHRHDLAGDPAPREADDSGARRLGGRDDRS